MIIAVSKPANTKVMKNFMKVGFIKILSKILNCLRENFVGVASLVSVFLITNYESVSQFSDNTVLSLFI